MGRSVLVTGGNRGIGLAIARRLQAGGDAVAVTYHSTPAPDGLFAVKCDVTDETSISEAFAAVKAEQGPVQVLVACAGTTRDKLMVRMSADDLDTVLATNLRGPVLCAKQAVRNMFTARWGRIIFISSVVALRGEAGQVNYAAAKAGLIGAARSMAREFGKYGVTANVVAPGLTETDMISTIPAEQLEHWSRKSRPGGWDDPRRSLLPSPSLPAKTPPTSTVPSWLSTAEQPPAIDHQKSGAAVPATNGER